MLKILIKCRFSHETQKKNFFRILPKKTDSPSIVYPNQYPKNLSDNSAMIPRNRKEIFLTPKDEIMQQRLMSNEDVVMDKIYNDKWESPKNSWFLGVGLIGPVNSGKSQLFTKLSHKVGTVSSKVNSTSDIINTIKSFEVEHDQGIKNTQLKYYDTPGLMYNKTGFQSKGWKVLSDIDFSLLVLDCTKRFDEMAKESILRLERHRRYENFMKALVLNKVDLIDNKRKFHSLIAQTQKHGKFDKIFYTSALTGYGIQQLEKYLLSMAKKGEWQYPKETYTNQSQIEIYEQFLKESLYGRTYKEVPYNLRIKCISNAIKSNGIQYLRFEVKVESQNQQRMLIGKQGNNIKCVIQKFKVLYCQQYQKEVQVYIKIGILNKFSKKYTINEQLIPSTEVQKYMQKQKIEVIQQYLQKSGKLLRIYQ